VGGGAKRRGAARSEAERGGLYFYNRKGFPVFSALNDQHQFKKNTSFFPSYSLILFL
jgi:hypothetical protein